MRDRIIPLLLAATLLGPAAAHAKTSFAPVAPASLARMCPGCLPSGPAPIQAVAPAVAPASLLTPTPSTAYIPLAPGRRVGATHDPDPFPARPRALS
jgi:hypothetical protein